MTALSRSTLTPPSGYLVAMRFVLSMLVAVGAIGCRTPDPNAPQPTPREYDVMLAAEQDFDCFRDEITVTPAGPELYEAKGCGKEGTYAVKCTPAGGHGGSNCTAHRVEPDESDEEDPAAAAEEGE